MNAAPTKTKLSDPGPKPDFKWLKLTELYIDPEYQRGTKSSASRANIAWLKENFCWAYFGTLSVCLVPEKKQYAVIDGQHRLQAALELGDIEAVPCSITASLEFKKQALSFVVVNTKRVTLNVMSKFHAAVAAGDPDAVSVKQVLDEAKVEIPRHPMANGDTRSRQTQACGTLLNLIKRYSANQMVWALTIIPDAFGDKRGQIRSMLIKALCEFIQTNPGADRERMTEVLSSVDVDKLEADSRAYVGISGGTSAAAMVSALERLYKNAGRANASNSPPPWKTPSTANYRAAWQKEAGTSLWWPRQRRAQGEGLRA